MGYYRQAWPEGRWPPGVLSYYYYSTCLSRAGGVLYFKFRHWQYN